jgi:hypothetical protein
VSGALAERDFVEKLEKAGFADVEVVARRPISVDEWSIYPLFTADLLELMRTLIPVQKQGSVAVSVVVKARLP